MEGRAQVSHCAFLMEASDMDTKEFKLVVEEKSHWGLAGAQCSSEQPSVTWRLLRAKEPRIGRFCIPVNGLSITHHSQEWM